MIQENPPHFMGNHMVSGFNFPSTNPLMPRNHCGKIFLALLFPARWSTSDAVLSQKTGPASHAGMESGQKRSQPLSHQPRGRGLSSNHEIKQIISKNHRNGDRKACFNQWVDRWYTIQQRLKHLEISQSSVGWYRKFPPKKY